MFDIYLIRHGETEWNVEGRSQGKLDSSLTKTGVSQAEAIARKLADLNIQADAFLTSPLGRTRQTASIIANHLKLPDLKFDERLAEVSVGSWDGLTHYDIDAQWPRVLDGSTHFDWFFRSPDGESYEMAVQRAKSWLDNTSGVVLAVSHGLIGRIIRGAYLSLPKIEVISLPVPQDVIWRLSGGKIERIALE
ncbi:histidine phosphatase family protein [Aquidulcibacter paucihalophilus]|uniref:histidine phosphatase family protein n=1 Tax=Aquidulcibacter paucihalophilus TaxID=1978549 RepID=UPI000D08DB9E|nr:histidine phosphatase family protein [Aquidulcibacter paucihalophilus]